MKPIGPLMREHRLIEHVVEFCRQEAVDLNQGKPLVSFSISKVVDFFRTYADKTHHGKEEDILFQKLEAKELTEKHRTIMEELIQEHKNARRVVTRLEKANQALIRGDTNKRASIIDCLMMIVTIYPSHIEKEDKHFFYPIIAYLTASEQSSMCKEFQDFDAKMIHRYYADQVELL